NRIHRTDGKARELPIIVTSGYRCLDLNKAIGGSTSSQHMKAQAVDFGVPGMTPRELVDFIVKHHPGYDQMIEEFGRWVHVSVVADSPRGEVLVARKSGGKTSYSPLKQNSK
ncbi:D-Ala-D-Ala carboxypeptidase family metallohydrolase, partial [Tritonibacter sp. SIMBA_163]|uniref:D-Ala-D-Ala carboxypeptidase family metallohydrolase n=1 Tax=Tritonibacter sp. SIMBA_163 TaxID=3080868 RepID=UPI0039812DF9